MTTHDRGNEHGKGDGRPTTDLDALRRLRKRSLHRLWWSSAQVALKRGPSAPVVRSPPTSHSPSPGKRG